MKRILITAGPVYGRLDDNKIVSNRSRGIWAVEFAIYLHDHGHDVRLLVPDIMAKQFEERLGKLHNEDGASGICIRTHSSYQDYATICNELAPQMDAAIMAAAVVNWIPETPFPGKMAIDKKRIEIPFILAPKVINQMKKQNPKLTLIGCKLLFSGDLGILAEAAYHVILAAKCNAVVANDAKLGLRFKHVFHQDRAITSFYNDFEGLYEHLEAIITDVHYRTVQKHLSCSLNLKSSRVFNEIAERYRDKFIRRVHREEFVFGSIAVPNFHPDEGKYTYVSPREKGELFDADDATEVTVSTENRTVYTNGGKATLNAPLLVRHLQQYPEAAGVVHYHCDPPSERPHLVVDHAPPGTVRDNDRSIPGPTYYITGHGIIMAVDEHGSPLHYG